MMLKSELNSTDTYSDQSQNDGEIILKIETADKNWTALFLNAEASDFKIKHRDFYYPVHRNVIFKTISLHVLDQEYEEGVLTLPDAFNPEMVQGVISCLYSHELKICRSQALQVLDIIYCLHISKLQKFLQEDIKNNIEDYQLFALLQKCLFMGLTELEQLCLNQLENEVYEQMRYQKFQLLNVNQDTFKFVLHHHNERRWEDPSFGQPEKFIQELIQEYAKHNNYNQKDKAQLIKEINQVDMDPDFPSFNKIKITPLKIEPNSEDSPMEIKLYTPRSLFKQGHSLNPKTMSPFDQNCISTKSMIVDLTYMGDRKRKGSRGTDHLGSQNKLASDYIVLKEQNKQIMEETEKMLESIEKMTKTLKQKEGESRNNKFKLGEIEGMLEECEKQLMEENRSIMLLDVRVDKATMRKISQPEADLEDDDDIDSSDSSEEQDTEAPSKSPNEKDKNLRVSLIQSKWVVC